MTGEEEEDGKECVGGVFWEDELEQRERRSICVARRTKRRMHLIELIT